MPKRIHILTILLLLTTLFVGCNKQAPSQSSREPLPEEYQKVVEKIEIKDRSKGQPTFSLSAEKLIEFADYAEFQKLGEIITYSEGKPEMKLTANKALWYDKQDKLVAIGDVLVKATEKDFRLVTPKLTYLIEGEKFESDGVSVVQTERYNLVADELKGDVKTKMLYAKGNMELKDQDGMEIKGSSLEFNWETEKYLIRGPISVRIKTSD